MLVPDPERIRIEHLHNRIEPGLKKIIPHTSSLYCVLGDFGMSIDTMVRNILLVFFLPLFYCH